MGRNVFSKLHAGMASLLILHICLALGAVVSYIFAAYVGFKLYRGDESFRGHMRLADRVIVPLRVLVLITSLLLVFLR